MIAVSKTIDKMPENILDKLKSLKPHFITQR